ncbi:MAG: cache domain-containing protein, partial [Candidatus Eiseniibacteriota bacterium]
MAATARAFGRSLGGRLFLLSGGLVLGAMAAAIGFTAWRAGEVADQWVSETLAASSAGQARVERQRLGQLRLLARFVATDPSFAAYVAEADPTSVRDLLLERQRDVGSDFMAVLDPRGRVVARSDRSGAAGEDLSSIPLVGRAVKRGEASGLLSDSGRYWTAIAVPIFAGQEALLGLLVAGLAVDDPLALEVRRGSGAEVAYVALEPEPRVIASTLGEDRELVLAVARHAAGARADSGSARLSVGGRTWAVRSARLEAGDDTAPSPATVVAVTLASLDQVLAPFRRIERVLVLVGVA